MKPCPSPETCGDCESFESRECLSCETVSLSEYLPGDEGTIAQVCGKPEMRLRLMEMGFVRGTSVKMVKYAPLTDPIEFVIKGYHVTLRRDEAAGILMNPPLNGHSKQK